MNALTIRRLGAADLTIFQELIALFANAFDTVGEPVAPAYLKALLMNPYFAVYVALADGALTGGATLYEMPLYTAPGAEAMIYDIAVAAPFRRQGVGLALLGAIRQDCLAQGIRLVFVAANEEDADALDFYRTAGGAESGVRYFEFEPGS